MLSPRYELIKPKGVTCNVSIVVDKCYSKCEVFETQRVVGESVGTADI